MPGSESVEAVRDVGCGLVNSLRRVLLGALALVLLLGGAPGQAAQAASPYGSVTGINGVLYDDCLAYPYRYDISISAGYWDLSTTLIGPGGATVASDYVARPTSGSSTFGLLCPSAHGYGRYTIRSAVRWGDDESSLGAPVALDDAHFTLRKPRSRTTLTASTRRPASGQVVRYRVTAYDERPAGYRPRAFAWVHLEQRRSGHWVRLKGGRAMTHATGRIVIRLRYAAHHRRTLIRAVTEPTTRYTRSTSPTLRLW
jgi:hypothetical protein